MKHCLEHCSTLKGADQEKTPERFNKGTVHKNKYSNYYIDKGALCTSQRV